MVALYGDVIAANGTVLYIVDFRVDTLMSSEFREDYLTVAFLYWPTSSSKCFLKVSYIKNPCIPDSARCFL